MRVEGAGWKINASRFRVYVSVLRVEGLIGPGSIAGICPPGAATPEPCEVAKSQLPAGSRACQKSTGCDASYPFRGLACDPMSENCVVEAGTPMPGRGVGHRRQVRVLLASSSVPCDCLIMALTVSSHERLLIVNFPRNLGHAKSAAPLWYRVRGFRVSGVGLRGAAPVASEPPHAGPPATPYTYETCPVQTFGRAGTNLGRATARLHGITNPHDQTKPANIRCQIHLDCNPFWGGGVKVNLRCI